jgi:hypothetical protein
MKRLRDGDLPNVPVCRLQAEGSRRMLGVSMGQGAQIGIHCPNEDHRPNICFNADRMRGRPAESIDKQNAMKSQQSYLTRLQRDQLATAMEIGRNNQCTGMSAPRWYRLSLPAALPRPNRTNAPPDRAHCWAHAPRISPRAKNARPENDATRDAKLSAGGPQPDDHGNEARPDAGKEGIIARLGARSARAQLKLRHKAIEYYPSQQNGPLISRQIER